VCSVFAQFGSISSGLLDSTGYAGVVVDTYTEFLDSMDLQWVDGLEGGTLYGLVQCVTWYRDYLATHNRVAHSGTTQNS